jgi:hypothetical protein
MEVVGKSKQFLFSLTFFYHAIDEIMWGNIVEPDRSQIAVCSMVHAHCMLDTKGYKHTLTICNFCWFSTATLVA